MTCFRQTPNWAQLLLVTIPFVAAACGGTDPDHLFAPSTPVADSGPGAVDASSSVDTPSDFVDAGAKGDAGVTEHADVVESGREGAHDSGSDGARLADAAGPDSSTVRVDAGRDAMLDERRPVQDSAPLDAVAVGRDATDGPDAPCVATDLCTTASRDPNGACVRVPVVCPAADECHVAGTCNPATGRCTALRAPEGAACTTEQGGRCNAAGACAPTFIVARVGDGTSDLTGNRAIAVRLERRYLAATAALVPEVGNPVALPTAEQGVNHPFSLIAQATGEGALSVSADGRYVTLAGYPVPPGTSPVSSTVGRVVARIDRNYAADTSTRLTVGLMGGNIRGAASLDGTQFWVSGGGDSPGIYFVALGQSGGTPILSEALAMRSVNIADNQLYATSLTTLLAVGTGTSSAMNQEVTTLLTGEDVLPFGFALVDRDPAVVGVDTAYIADGSEPDAGGIQRWSKGANGRWRYEGTFIVRAEGGVRAVAAFVRGGVATVVATTGEVEQNSIISFVDSGSEQSDITTLRSAIAGSGFRGVAFAP